MKFLFTILLSFFCIIIFAQGIEPYLGMNTSKFYFNENKNNDVLAIYQPTQGTCYGVFVDQSNTKAKIPSFSLQYEDYQGRIVLNAAGNSTDVLYAKSSLGFGVYLLNKNFWKNFVYHSGLEISLLLNERFEGQRRLDSGSFENFTELEHELSKPVSVFIKNQIAYDFDMSKKWSFRLQGAFLFGLNSEFFLQPDITKSLRFFGGAGFVYNLGIFE